MRFFSILILVIFNISFFFSQEVIKSNEVESKTDSLVGIWKLDLRPTPDAAPYYKTLTIIKEKDGTYSGTFYGSQIDEIYINQNWNETYFAFRTSDNSNYYYQTGILVGSKMKGTSFCPGRAFIMPWTGNKA